MDFAGKPLRRWLRGRSAAVVGLGISGVAAARCLIRLGARVYLSDVLPEKKVRAFLPKDLQNIDGEFGGHTRRLLQSEILIVSPGVHWDLSVLKEARKRGIPVWSELELGSRLTQFKYCIAVTGTNGKTTSTALMGDMCRRAGLNPFVGGNIGKPLSGEVFSNKPRRAAVLEVSSYQLEGIQTFHPDAAIVLNITPDHLEHHGSMAAYARAKERIFENQGPGDLTVLNADDRWCRGMSRRVRSRTAWISTERVLAKGVYFDRKARKIAVRNIPNCIKADLELPRHLIGVHNIENCCASVAAALKIGVPLRAVKDSLKNFKGVEHRLENVSKVGGVVYINDSKGTNVDSTVKALEAVPAPIWLILGGQDKGAPYGPLRDLIRRKVKGILLIGEASSKIKKELAGTSPFYSCGTLYNAVRKAGQLAVAGDRVLLSPACASFDQFKNFEDRGNQFKGFVRSLKK